MKFDNEASKLNNALQELNKEFPDFNLTNNNTVEDIINNSLFCFGKLTKLKKVLENKEKQINVLNGIVDSNQQYIDKILSNIKIKDFN